MGSRAVKYGLMGAILGGLKFKLDEDTARRAEEAQLRKEARLQEIAMQAEQRANVEWERRAGIDQQNRLEVSEVENEQLIGRQEIGFKQDLQKQEVGHRLDKDRIGYSHELDLKEAQVQAGLTRANQTHQGAITRANQASAAARNRELLEYRETLVKERPTRPSDIKGIQGSDGKFYPAGTPLPPGVVGVAGYGTTWAPSASKGEPTTPSGRRPRHGEEPKPKKPAGKWSGIRIGG